MTFSQNFSDLGSSLLPIPKENNRRKNYIYEVDVDRKKKAKPTTMVCVQVTENQLLQCTMNNKLSASRQLIVIGWQEMSVKINIKRTL